MSRTFRRHTLAALTLFTTVVLSPVSGQTPREATSADTRLRVLYTDEWNWRQREFARGDSLAARAPIASLASMRRPSRHGSRIGPRPWQRSTTFHSTGSRPRKR